MLYFKTFSVASIDVKAVVSHDKGEKHKWKLPQLT